MTVELSAPRLIDTLAFEDYPALIVQLAGMEDDERRLMLRSLCKFDLYFLLRYGCERIDLEHQWIFERCREIQRSPNGHLDLWAREHGKSSCITFGLTIQDILNDPEVTVGIFSHTRPIAKAFLRQIKREFESNENLKALFPDVLWDNPAKESPKWSEDDGLIVKRRSNPPVATVEAWGVVDGQPTSKHFQLRVYDDMVTAESVTTPDMIEKTTRMWELSDNLGTAGGAFRIIGTRYHFNDSYGEMMRRSVVKPRIHKCTVNGEVDGEPVFMSREVIAQKYALQGSSTFRTQMLLDPRGDESQGFKREWLRYSKGQPARYGLNVYILVDPASKKTKTSDYTTMWAIGMGHDRNYVVLDVVRDKLRLNQRAEALFHMHEKWRPIKAVGYEEYGLQADIEHIEDQMEQRNYRFTIKPLGGRMAKRDRIAKLLPVFEAGRFYLKDSHFYTQFDGRTVDLMHAFVEEEYLAFPVPVHDDMLDSMARILDPELNASWPEMQEAQAIRTLGRLPSQSNIGHRDQHGRVSSRIRSGGGSGYNGQEWQPEEQG